MGIEMDIKYPNPVAIPAKMEIPVNKTRKLNPKIQIKR